MSLLRSPVCAENDDPAPKNSTSSTRLIPARLAVDAAPVVTVSIAAICVRMLLISVAAAADKSVNVRPRKSLAGALTL